MSFAFAGADALDYAPCNYGVSKLIFRGPRQALHGRYCAVLGGTETYGKFVPDPWPTLVMQATGTRMVNLACVNAGPDLYLGDEGILDVARGAALTILQITGAANVSNPLYSVHPRRNDRFLRASSWLQTLYSDVDFTEFHFTRHLLGTLQQVSPQRFEVVAGALREAWTEKMTQLVQALGGRVVLLWMGEDAPPEDAIACDAGTPWLVTGAMIRNVNTSALGYIEVVMSDAARTEGVEAMAFGHLERAAAAEVPGPKAHGEVAGRLAGVIGGFMG